MQMVLSTDTKPDSSPKALHKHKASISTKPSLLSSDMTPSAFFLHSQPTSNGHQDNWTSKRRFFTVYLKRTYTWNCLKEAELLVRWPNSTGASMDSSNLQGNGITDWFSSYSPMDLLFPPSTPVFSSTTQGTSSFQSMWTTLRFLDRRTRSSISQSLSSKPNSR